MRVFLIAGVACVLAGCGGQSAFKDYRDEEARLFTVQGSLRDLHGASSRPAHFSPRRMGGQDIPSEYDAALDATIAAAESFTDNHSGSDQYDKVEQILETARELKAMNAKGPSDEITQKVTSMHDLAESLEMRPMTADEEADIEKSIK